VHEEHEVKCMDFVMFSFMSVGATFNSESSNVLVMIEMCLLKTPMRTLRCKDIV
jgi:hypothetical protein